MMKETGEKDFLFVEGHVDNYGRPYFTIKVAGDRPRKAGFVSNFQGGLAIPTDYFEKLGLRKKIRRVTKEYLKGVPWEADTLTHGRPYKVGEVDILLPADKKWRFPEREIYGLSVVGIDSPHTYIGLDFLGADGGLTIEFNPVAGIFRARARI